MPIYSAGELTQGKRVINTHTKEVHVAKDKNYTLCGMMIKRNPLVKPTEKESNMCTNCYLEMIGNMFKKR